MEKTLEYINDILNELEYEKIIIEGMIKSLRSIKTHIEIQLKDEIKETIS